MEYYFLTYFICNCIFLVFTFLAHFLSPLRKQSSISFVHHTVYRINSIAVSPAASQLEIYSKRSCKGEKRKLKLTCDVIRKDTVVLACTGREMTAKATIREAAMHWPRLNPLPLCATSCRHPPLPLLNAPPPSVSALSICKLPHW